MTQDDCFRQEIIANPSDDTPRLIYADWLEEQDRQPYAEFIRIQCQLARMEESDPNRTSLSLRAAALLQQHREQFLGALAPIFHKEGISTDPGDLISCFCRGFLETARLPLQTFVRNADELFVQMPLQTLLLFRTIRSQQRLRIRISRISSNL